MIHRALLAGVLTLSMPAFSGAAAGSITTSVGLPAPADAPDVPPLRVGESPRLEGALGDADAIMSDGTPMDVVDLDCEAGILDVVLRSTAFDAYLIVLGLDAAGEVLWTEEDDDGGGNLNSRVMIALEERTRIRVIANAVAPDSRGAYVLTYRLGDGASEAEQRAMLVHRATRAAQQASNLFAAGEYEDARPYMLAAAELHREALGDDHPDTIVSVGSYGVLLETLGLAAEAEPYFRDTLERSRRVLGEEHPDTLIAVNNYGSVLDSLGRPGDAEPYYREAMDVSRRVLGDEAAGTLIAINNYAVVLRSFGRTADAVPYFQETLDVRRRTLGDEHPDTLISINNYGIMLQSLGRSAEAEPYYRACMDARRRALGGEHPETLTAISNYGFVLEALGRAAEAETYLQAALEGRRQFLGPEHPNTLVSMSNYASVLLALGRAAEAEPYCRQALEVRRRTLGDEHPDTLSSINAYGFVLSALGRYSEAEPYFGEALDAMRRGLGPDHPRTLIALNNYGGVLDSLGRLSESEAFQREALEGRRRVLGNEHPDTLGSLNNCGALMDALGRATEAEAYFREALDTRHRILGDDHPDTLTSRNNYGALLHSVGRASEAEAYHRETLDGRRRVLGDDHPDTLASIGNYGAVLDSLGRTTEAETYHRAALEGRRRVLGPEHPQTLVSLSNYGSVLRALGRSAEAEPYDRDVLIARRRLLGDDHPDTLISISNQGVALESVGRMADAQALYEEALGTRRRVLGDEHPDTLMSVAMQAFHHVSSGRPEDALPLMLEYIAGAERLRDTTPGDEQARSARSADLSLATLTLNAAALSLEVDGDAAAAFDLVERGRGRTLLDLIARSEENIFRVLRRQAPMAAAAYRQAIVDEAEARDLVRRLEALAAAAARRGDDAERERLDAKAIAARAARGRATFAVFALIREHLRSTAPTPAAAAQQFLEPGTVLLSLGIEGDVGVAITLSPDAAHGAAINDAAAVASRLGALRSAAASGERISEEAIAGLRRSLLSPELAAMLAAAQRVVIMPSPALAGVPFEIVLPRVPITFASSASVYFDRLDAADELIPGRRATMVAAGDPDFSGMAGLVAATGAEADLDPRALARVETVRSASRDQLRSFGGTLTPLPGTRAEVRSIEAVAEAAGVTVHELMGAEAAVPALRELVEQHEPRYLHLATHGFPGTSARPYTASLALTTPASPAPEDTGFLTLDDLIQGWFGLLDETDLVVLSACDTGVGVARGDSDMALPWGFYFAGTPTVICSLWAVDDTATALLMGRLYENLLGRTSELRTVWNRTYEAGTTIPKADALDEAKAWLRGLTRLQAQAALDAIGLTDQPLPRGFEPDAPAASSDAATPYAHPQYWAAFVLRGSPR